MRRGEKRRMKMKMKANEINSAGIRAECAKMGISEIERIDDGKHDGARATLYQVGDVEVLDTNGDPVWKEACTENEWQETLNFYGIKIYRIKDQCKISAR